MKVVVTGGCGYIGSHTIIELIENTEFEVICVDSLINSTDDSLDRVFELTGTRVANNKIDVCDKEAFRNLLSAHSDIVGIIHFAALKSVPDSVADPILYYHNNIESLLNVLAVGEELSIPYHIFSSSCSVYGNVSDLPVNETTVLSKTESPYAHTKIIGEQVIEAFSGDSNLKTIALRYFNPVGAHITGKNGENPINRPNNLVPVITQTAAGIIPKMTVFGDDYDTRDGSCVRDYVHVTDIARAHVLALEKQVKGDLTDNFDIINLGTGNGVTVIEAIKAFEEVSGSSLNYEIGPRRDGDVGAIYSDISKATNKLGWTPEYGIIEMMESAWKWQINLLKEA